MATQTGMRTSRSRTETAVGQHSFAPGDEVAIYPAHQVEIERQENRAPIPGPEKTVKVTDDGSFSVSGLSKGSYLAYAERSDAAGNVSHAWQGFTVK